MPPSSDATVITPPDSDDATRLDPPGDRFSVVVQGRATVADDDAATLLQPTPAAEEADDEAATLLDPASPARAPREVHEAGTVLVDDRVLATDIEDRAPTIAGGLEEATVVAPPTGSAPTVGGTERTPAAGGGPSRDHGVRYVVEGTAGQGGMGTVHVARDVDLLRRVALKELSANVAHDRGARSRFVREVQVTAQLDHPHIVPVYSLEVAQGGRPAYAMKLVEGQTFATLVADTRAAYEAGREPDEDHSLPARLEHFLKVCDAVEYAHARGVVHRDLKPANLMLGRHNEVYVMDWGICRLVSQAPEHAATAQAVNLEAGHGETAFGAIVGTPLYMSPEQAEGRHADLDARSDQCALGLILFELVTLQRPFAGRTLAAILQQASTGARQPIVHAFHAPVPPELVAIITRATAVDQTKRYRDVAALADDLRRYLRGDAVEARPDSAWQTVVRRLARHRQAVALGVLGLVVAGLATVLGLLWRHDRALEAQTFRERRVGAFVASVADLGDRLQTRLLEINGGLEAMAAAAGQAVDAGVPSSAPVPWPDIVRAGGAATQRHVVFATAPSVSRQDVEPLARRLVLVADREERLLGNVRRILGGKTASGADDSGLIELRGAFENGLRLVLPAAALARMYPDPRQAPWYRAVKEKAGFQWTPVNADDDAARELAVSTPVVDHNGRFVGALGLVLSLDHILVNLLADQSIPGVRAAMLLDSRAAMVLDGEGGVLATHASAAGRAGSGDGYLRTFPVQELHTAMKAQDAGTFDTDRFGSPHIVAFDRVYPTDWVLLLVIEESTLLAPALPSAAGRR